MRSVISSGSSSVKILEGFFFTVSGAFSSSFSIVLNFELLYSGVAMGFLKAGPSAMPSFLVGGSSEVSDSVLTSSLLRTLPLSWTLVVTGPVLLSFLNMCLPATLYRREPVRLALSLDVFDEVLSLMLGSMPSTSP